MADIKKDKPVDLIDRNKVLEVMQRFVDARSNCNCSRQRMIEAQAFKYAIQVIKQVKSYDEGSE